MRRLATERPVGDLRTRLRHATELEISSTAARLFLAHGTNATTVADIAAAAGVSQRTFHRYFGAKTEALGPVLEEGLLRYLDAVKSLAPDLDEAELLDALADILTSSLANDGSGRDPELLRLVLATPDLLSLWLRLHEECAVALGPLLSPRLSRHTSSIETRFFCAAVVTASRLAVENWAEHEGDLRQQARRLLQLLPPLPLHT